MNYSFCSISFDNSNICWKILADKILIYQKNIFSRVIFGFYKEIIFSLSAISLENADFWTRWQFYSYNEKLLLQFWIRRRYASFAIGNKEHKEFYVQQGYQLFSIFISSVRLSVLVGDLLCVCQNIFHKRKGIRRQFH